MDGPGKDMFPIPGQKIYMNFILIGYWTNRSLGFGFAFLSKCYIRTTAPRGLVHIWACQEGACEVSRELCLDFDTAEQRLKGFTWARLHFLTA